MVREIVNIQVWARWTHPPAIAHEDLVRLAKFCIPISQHDFFFFTDSCHAPKQAGNQVSRELALSSTVSSFVYLDWGDILEDDPGRTWHG